VTLPYITLGFNQWKLLPSGRGLFEFSFASADDKRNVWSIGTYDLKPGLLHLLKWEPYFNIHTQKQSHVQSWGHWSHI
jgi:hypothetical protein